jgi:hypothetical protein
LVTSEKQGFETQTEKKDSGRNAPINAIAAKYKITQA